MPCWRWRFPRSERGRGFISLHVSGIISGNGAHEGPTGLAISVNGMIRATTRTYIIDGFESRFEAMLPPDSLIPGANELRVFRVTEAAGAFRLAEI